MLSLNKNWNSLIKPSKIICVGRSYAEHAKELGNDVPDEPVIFLKPKSAFLQPHMPFYYPEFTNELHYEAELVLRVSKNGKYIQEHQASKYYDSITVGIDFTARDLQQQLKEKGLPWEIAKSFDNAAPISESWLNKDEYDLNEIEEDFIIDLINQYLIDNDLPDEIIL